jgi:hypothetical protein
MRSGACAVQLWGGTRVVRLPSYKEVVGSDEMDENMLCCFDAERMRCCLCCSRHDVEGNALTSES